MTTPINNLPTPNYAISHSNGEIDVESRIRLPMPSGVKDNASSRDDLGSLTVETENFEEDVIRESKQIPAIANEFRFEFESSNLIN